MGTRVFVNGMEVKDTVLRPAARFAILLHKHSILVNVFSVDIHDRIHSESLIYSLTRAQSTFPSLSRCLCWCMPVK